MGAIIDRQTGKVLACVDIDALVQRPAGFGAPPIAPLTFQIDATHALEVWREEISSTRGTGVLFVVGNTETIRAHDGD